MSRQGTVFTIRQQHIGLWLGIGIFWASWLWAQGQGVIVHTPPTTATASATIQMSAQCQGVEASVRLVRIYFKSPQHSSYRFVDMQPREGLWVGQIPARFVQGERIQYFITALLDNQTILTFPRTNPYNQPQEISITAPVVPVEPAQPTVVIEAAAPTPAPQLEQPATAPVERPALAPPPVVATADTSQPPPPIAAGVGVDSIRPPAVADSSAQWLILSPESQASLMADEIVFAASFMADSSELDTASVRLFWDGKDVTPFAAKSALLVSYEPRDIKPGDHWFKIEGRTRAGLSVPPSTVSFTVQKKGRAPTPSHFQGHAFTDLRHEQFYLQKKNIGMLGADFSGQYGAWEFGGNLFITSLEDKKYQPRNRYGFRLATKQLGIGIGDVYPQMNELILWGRRVRGASAYLHLGFFNIDGVYGEINRAIPSVTARAVAADGSDSTYVAQYGTFRQKLIGIRPAFGNGRRFQVGITFVKIKDEISSIRYGLQPKDNVVFGPDLSLSLHGNRIRLEAVAAVSLLTTDIYPGAANLQELKDTFGSFDLPIDPQDIDSWLIINDSTTPLNPLAGSSLAYRLQARINYWHNLFTIGYKSIGPQYLSLGNPWLRTDIQGLYLSDRLRLWQNKVYLSLGYEGMADNFSKQNNEPVLDLLTFNYALTLYPGSKWPMLTISLKDHLRDNHLRSIYYDTLQVSDSPEFLPDSSYIARDERERQLFRDFSAQVSHHFRWRQLHHHLSAGYIVSKNIDQFKDSRLAGFPLAEMTNTLAMFSLTTTFRFPLKTTLSAAANENKLSLHQTVSYNSIGFAAEYGFLNNKLLGNGEGRYTIVHRWQNSAKLGMQRLQIRAGINWQIVPGHSLLVDVNLMRNTGALASVANRSGYHDILLRMRYDKYF